MENYNRRTLYSIVENGEIIKTDVIWKLFPDRRNIIDEEPTQEFLNEHNLVKVISDFTYDKETKRLMPVEPYILGDNVYNKVIVNKNFIKK